MIPMILDSVSKSTFRVFVQACGLLTWTWLIYPQWDTVLILGVDTLGMGACCMAI